MSFAGQVPGGGHTLTIRTPDGYAVTIQQLETVNVSRGTVVAEGDPIGTVGVSTETDVLDAHVHLGIRIASDPNGYVDPLGLLPEASSGMQAEAEASGSIVDTDAAVSTADSSPSRRRRQAARRSWSRRLRNWARQRRSTGARSETRSPPTPSEE